MRRAWIPASAELAIGLAIVMTVGAAGCLSDAIKQNQQQLDQQKTELDQLKQQVADLQAAQQPSYPTTAPPPGSCDKAVMQVATRHGGERLAMDYYRRAVQAAPADHDAHPAVAEQAQQALARLAAK